MNGVAAKFGGGTLAGFEDITSKVGFDLTNSAFDRAANTVVVSAQLENRSKDTLAVPIKGRVVGLSSALARTIRMNDAAEGDGGPGSVLDLGDVIDGGILRPGEKSRPKKLSFKLSDLLLLRTDNDIRFGLVSLQMTVLGKASTRGR